MFALRSPKQGIVGSRQRGALVSKSVQVKAGSKKKQVMWAGEKELLWSSSGSEQVCKQVGVGKKPTDRGVDTSALPFLPPPSYTFTYDPPFPLLHSPSGNYESMCLEHSETVSV